MVIPLESWLGLAVVGCSWHRIVERGSSLERSHRFEGSRTLRGRGSTRLDGTGGGVHIPLVSDGDAVAALVFCSVQGCVGDEQ